MTIQNYSTSASRNLIRAAMDMLDHAEPITVLGDFGVQREMPQNQTDTLVFRRTLPFGSNTVGTTVEAGGGARYVGTPSVTPSNFVLAEGTTPNANTVAFQDITVTLVNYGILYKYSSKVELMYEDDIPAELVKQTGETMAEILELVRYGILKAGSTVIYSNGSSRATVATAVSLATFRKAARTLEANRAKRVTSRIAPGPNYATRSVAPSYLVFHHTDVSADIRNLANFTRVEDYGNFKPVHDREIGAAEQFRFVDSPLFAPFLAAGAAVGTTGLVSQGAANVDVYPILVVAADAWGQVALKGMSAIKPISLKPSTVNHANPLGMFGFVGANTWFAAVRLNEAWMARVEAGATAL
jgi:N4-gp56 family major capsid protein